jgi:hypothetical protein
MAKTKNRRQRSSEVDHEVERAAITALMQGLIRGIVEILLQDIWHGGFR